MTDLSTDQLSALDRARAEPLSYAVQLLRAPDGRTLAVLGEAHVKLGKAAAIGQSVVESFELRGVETFQRRKVVGGAALGVLITAPRTLARALTFGAMKGSTIVDAKTLPSGHTVELERTDHVPLGLHVASVYLASFFAVGMLATLAPVLGVVLPGVAGAILFLGNLFRLHFLALAPAIVLRRHSWSWMVHPFLGILTLRDELMAAGAIRMLADHPEDPAAVVVMGRAHVSGFGRILVERHGFARADRQ